MLRFLEILTWRDAVDVLAVAVIIYNLLLLIRGTRAVQMVLGLLFIGLVYYTAVLTELPTLQRILENLLIVLPFAVIVLFQQEIRPTDELDLPTRKRPGKAKVDRAVALVEALGADFDHSAYKDRYRSRLRKIVKDKEAGETIEAPPAPKAPGPPPDIMEALKASLDKVRAG